MVHEKAVGSNPFALLSCNPVSEPPQRTPPIRAAAKGRPKKGASQPAAPAPSKVPLVPVRISVTELMRSAAVKPQPKPELKPQPKPELKPGRRLSYEQQYLLGAIANCEDWPKLSPETWEAVAVSLPTRKQIELAEAKDLSLPLVLREMTNFLAYCKFVMDSATYSSACAVLQPLIDELTRASL